MQNAHDPLSDSIPHDQKLRFPVVGVALERLPQATRIDLHGYFHPQPVQCLTGVKHFLLR
jgi:hypothetical protein